MNLHELFTLLILLIGTLGTNQIQYMKCISEYIPKLQIHQQFRDFEKYKEESVDVFVTLECIHLYVLCIVP